MFVGRSADGLLGLGILGGALLVGGVVAAGAVALADMGIAKLKKLDHPLDFPCCII